MRKLEKVSLRVLRIKSRFFTDFVIAHSKRVEMINQNFRSIQQERMCISEMHELNKHIRAYDTRADVEDKPFSMDMRCTVVLRTFLKPF